MIIKGINIQNLKNIDILIALQKITINFKLLMYKETETVFTGICHFFLQGMKKII